MAVSVKRIQALVAVAAAATALLLPGSPASAQAGGPGAQATPVVGVSGTANCPTAVPAAQVVYAGPAGPFTIVQSDGACTSFSANSQGTFTVTGATGTFSSGCQTGGLQSGGAVTVPTGTIVNGVAVTQPTVVATPNTPVIFPGGIAATLNVVQTTATTVTRTAIVSGGTQIGRVICGQANVYPLAADTAAAAAPGLPSPVASSSDSGGPSTGLLLIGGAIALLVLGQVAIVRTVRRRKGDATA